VPNESHPAADEVHIEQLEVFTVIGVLEHERKGLQRLTVSISFWPYEQAQNLADNIEKAVNYAAVAEETKRFAREQAVNLIETLADGLAVHLLKSFPIQKVRIELRKFALPDARYVSATVTRTAASVSVNVSQRRATGAPSQRSGGNASDTHGKSARPALRERGKRR
jgi:dihydroneopterin aldolase